MGSNIKGQKYNYLISILIWGSYWGIFEATVGYFLHSISFPYSFLVWYPVACFFMYNVYRKTHQLSSVFAVGVLCAFIKLLNLFLPGRIDKVINPAVAIVFEALAMFITIALAQKFWVKEEKNVFRKAVIAFSMNTLWRVFYIIYLAFFVPEWIREISVIISAEKFIPFFITQNFLTSMIVFIGYQYKTVVLKLFLITERKFAAKSAAVPPKRLVALQVAFTIILLGVNISLQLLLK
ncbi:MAG TPA: hypothetical protein VFC76_06050 [Oscillospiraceae bacterium]|nr:hypothetical protein [Oscillospiraceae bacterium]